MTARILALNTQELRCKHYTNVMAVASGLRGGGSLLTSDFQIINDSILTRGAKERFGFKRALHISDKRIFRSKRVIGGNSLYLGHFFAHYGHFLLESLSKAWIMGIHSQAYIDNFIFHVYSNEQIPPYALWALKALGIPTSKVRIIRENTILQSVLVAESAFIARHSVNTNFITPFRQIVDYASDGKIGMSSCKGENAIYASRRRLSYKERLVLNEDEIEALMKRLGFTILHPQEMTIEEQVLSFNNAHTVAGATGSALHNVVFGKPGQSVIHFSARRVNPNYKLIDLLVGVKPLLGYPAHSATATQAL
jgi:capsular polysaccharide biosynthesis protein